jgi:predicted PurR-regulated permease PerM
VTDRRRYVLGGALVVVSLLAAAILASVLGTVFFAITVGYLLSPVRRRLLDRGLSRWWASAITTVGAFGATVLATLPIVVVVFLRLETAIAALGNVPRTITIEQFGFTYTVTFEEAVEFVQALATSLASAAATEVPVLLIKLTLFGLLVFSLLYNEERARIAIIAVVPRTYRDVVRALNRRTRETLFAIYVLQAATAVGTFIIALPIFILLGYGFPFTLATLAAVLQFIPILGPSLVVFSLSLYHVAVGQLPQAVAIFVIGGVLIAWLPDVLIRPRLASETAHLPGGLYFVGFVGGLLTLGPVGVIAGPLVVALVLELAGLVSTELNDIPIEED